MGLAVESLERKENVLWLKVKQECKKTFINVSTPHATRLDIPASAYELMV
jgi:hypothetical protein